MKTTAKAEIIRAEWPKIRLVEIKGESFYQVDARKTGTAGKRLHFKTKADAEEKAAALAKLYDTGGTEELAIPAAVRAQVALATRILADLPGATLVLAAEHYRDYLLSRKASEESATVASLAEAWNLDKSSGSKRKLRQKSIDAIRQASARIAKAFAGKRIGEITTQDVEQYVSKQGLSLRGAFNLNALFSQFFNWCIKQRKLAANPCEAIEIVPEGSEVVIFNPDRAAKLMQLCEKEFPQYVLYFAIGLFAGLRPEECLKLKWENVHLEERTITVLASTSKVKETRNVHIEDSLHTWLMAYKPENLSGYVTDNVGYKKGLRKVYVAFGYRGDSQNLTADYWPTDVTRHSFGSYHLAKYSNRALLAEQMGNSVQVIKKHYKQVVSKSAVAAYWEIAPSGEYRKGLPKDANRLARWTEVAEGFAHGRQNVKKLGAAFALATEMRDAERAEQPA